MDLPYLFELFEPLLSSMLAFEDFAYLRMCTKQLYAAQWPLIYLRVFAPTIRSLYAPSYTMDWQTGMFYMKQICQHCLESTAVLDPVSTSNVYAHVRCVNHKKIDDFLTFPNDKQLMKESMRYFRYVPHDKHFRDKAKLFTNVRKWLSLDRNSAFDRVYHDRVLGLAFEYNMFKEKTVKTKLVRFALEAALGFVIRPSLLSCDWPQMKYNFLEYVRKHKKRVVRRYKALSLELFCLIGKEDVQEYVNLHWQAIENYANYDTVFCYCQKDYDGEACFNAHHIAVDIVSAVQFGRGLIRDSLWHFVAKQLVGKEYYHKRLMRRWRGVARFIGKVIVQRKATQEPPAKRIKIE